MPVEHIRFTNTSYSLLPLSGDGDALNLLGVYLARVSWLQDSTTTDPSGFALQSLGGFRLPVKSLFHLKPVALLVPVALPHSERVLPRATRPRRAALGFRGEFR
jgi:hypothetical protein